MPEKLEIVLADNVRESVNFDSILKKGNKIQAISARYAAAVMFNPDASSRATAIQGLQAEVVDYYDKKVIPAATQVGREQAKRVVRMIGGGVAPADINDANLRRRILFEGEQSASDRLRIVQRLVNDQANTLENRLGVYWLEPGRDAKSKLDQLRRIHNDGESRRMDYEKRLAEWEASGGAGRRPTPPRLDYLSKFTREATQSVREQGRRVGTDAEHAEFQKQGFQIFTWVTVNAGDACPDCRKRQGTTGTMEYFDEIGRPGSGATVCKSACFCILVPKETIYHAPGLARGIDVPGQREPETVITTPKEAEKIEAQKVTPPPVAATPKEPIETLKDQMAADKESRRIVGKIAKAPEAMQRALDKLRPQKQAALARAEKADQELFDIHSQPNFNEADAKRVDGERSAALREYSKLREKGEKLMSTVKEQALKHVQLPAAKRFESVRGIPTQSGVPTRFQNAKTGTDAKAAEEFIQSVTKRPAEFTSKLPGLTVQYQELAPGSRPYHVPYAGVNAGASGVMNTIAIAPTNGAELAVHEWGHELEARLPGAGKAANAFLDLRLAGRRPVSMAAKFPTAGYAVDEMGADDDFGKLFGKDSTYSFYAGKRYKSGQTEIISMGLERLFFDPVGFAAADPQYLQFIIGILHGRIQF